MALSDTHAYGSRIRGRLTVCAVASWWQVPVALKTGFKLLLMAGACARQGGKVRVMLYPSRI
jgi:hypothetical protein